MKDNAALARGWMRKGDSDLADARRTVGSDGPYDTACFHAQQAVEKYSRIGVSTSRELPGRHSRPYTCSGSLTIAHQTP